MSSSDDPRPSDPRPSDFETYMPPTETLNKTEAELLRDIEARGGIVVYTEFSRQKILDCLLSDTTRFGGTTVGCKPSRLKRYWQNRTTRIKSWKLPKYLDHLKELGITPHTQTQRRCAEIENRLPITRVTWFPFESDTVAISTNDPIPTKFQKDPEGNKQPGPSRTRNQQRRVKIKKSSTSPVAESPVALVSAESPAESFPVSSQKQTMSNKKSKTPPNFDPDRCSK